MNFTDLQTFLSVAEESSISCAAKVLYVTQPAVTKRIQALEAKLQVQLFDRVGKRVLLTQAGHLLVPQAEKILATVRDAEQQLHNLSSNVSGTLHLATSHHIGLHRLEPVLRGFKERYPDVQMNILFEDSEVAHEMVRRGSIELAVVTLDPIGAAGLSYTPVWHDPLQFVNKAAQTTTLSMSELATQPCVLPGTATYTGRIVLQRFEAAGIVLLPAMSTNYLETIEMLVNVGLGWSVLPNSMIGKLCIMNVECSPMSRTLGCVTNPARSMSNAANAFVEVLESYRDTVM